MSIRVTPLMPKPRGGQRKHWAEKAQVWAWYWEVKRRCGWSDYLLNYEFAWTDEGCKSRASDYRPRIFECIRKSARKPAGRDKRWRSMSELVVAVEQHPRFKGTQALYEAEIWDLFQETAPTPDIVQNRIERLLQANRLERVPLAKLSAKPDLLIKQFGREQLFDLCLQLSLRESGHLSGIALVWSLYQQTEHAHNWQIRAVLESIADQLLDEFFYYYLPDQNLVFYTNAVRVLLQTRIDFSSQKHGGYASLETLATWPVIPQALVGKLTEHHLRLVIFGK